MIEKEAEMEYLKEATQPTLMDNRYGCLLGIFGMQYSHLTNPTLH